MSTYGPDPAIKLPHKRRLEVGTAAVFTDHFNEERNAWFQTPRSAREEQRGPTLAASSCWNTESGEEMKLQTKGIHVARAIQRWKEGRTFSEQVPSPAGS